MSGLESFLSSLQECRTVSISSINAAVKTSALFAIVEKILAAEKQVHYVDLDLQYSSMLSNTPSLAESKLQQLKVLRSGERWIVELFVSLLNSSGVKKEGLIVIDSINTLQTLLQKRDSPIDYLNANHKAAILTTLAQEFADRNSKVLILASVVRPRPKQVQGSEIWEMELSGGRMIKLKSDILVSVSHDPQDLRPKNASLKITVESVAGRYSGTLRKGQSFKFEPMPFT